MKKNQKDTKFLSIVVVLKYAAGTNHLLRFNKKIFKN